MARLLRTFAALAVAGVAVGGVGFVVFAESVARLTPSENARADGIVVLTGDEDRIATGVRLMVEGRAQRLLISGVNPATRVPTELKRRIHGVDAAREAVVRCCVDIGREALNTSGNADEARQWVREHGFGSLIVVTSAYHMLRSRAEFSRAMPDIRLVDYPVVSGRRSNLDDWWRHWATARLLASEYVKALGALARLGLARILESPAPLEGPRAPVDLPSASVSAGTRP